MKRITLASFRGEIAVAPRRFRILVIAFLVQDVFGKLR